MNYKICAIGENSSLFPFMQIGVDVFPLENVEELPKTLSSLINKGYGLFFISEDAVGSSMNVIHSYDKRPDVNIVLVPGNKEGGSYGMERINSMVEKALGQNIL